MMPQIEVVPINFLKVKFFLEQAMKAQGGCKYRYHHHHHHHHHHLLLSLMGVNKTSPSGPFSGHPLHLAPALPF